MADRYLKPRARDRFLQYGISSAYDVTPALPPSEGWDFESYTTGELVGQEDWEAYNTSTGSCAVVDTIGADSTSQCVRLESLNSSAYHGAKTEIPDLVSAVAAGDCILSLYLRRTATCGFNCYSMLRLDGGSNFSYILWNDPNNSSYPPSIRGTDTFTLAQISDDTWYFLEYYFRSSDGYMRYRIDGSAWSAYTSPYVTGWTEFGMLAKGYGSGKSQYYFDEIKITMV